MSDQVVDLLTRGRQNLIKRGLAKHSYIDADNQVCAIGALLLEVPHDKSCDFIALCSISNRQDYIAVEQAMSLLRSSLLETDSIIAFNDRPNTKLDDIVAVYDRAIEVAQKRVADNSVEEKSE